MDTVSKALKCIGLFSVIVRMAVDDVDVTRGELASRIGTSLPGLIRPLEYLSRLGVIAYVERRLPGRLGPVITLAAHPTVIESVRRDVKRRFAQASVVEHGFELPYPWQDTVGYVLKHRTSHDTAAKLLKSLGVIPFITRLAANGVPITRPILARRLGVAENTLTPLISFLEKMRMIDVTERRIIGHIGSEYALTTPQAVVERVRREMRKLEKEKDTSGWADAAQYRQMEQMKYQLINESHGSRFAAI